MAFLLSPWGGGRGWGLMKSVRIRASIALALLTTVLISGCGQRLNEVTGKVTLDGRTVPGMEVRFEPKDPSIGTTAIGYTQADGTYTLHYPGDKTGAPAGEYTVTITGGEAETEGRPAVRVAPKYNSASQLTATVKPGQNTFNFDVTSAKPQPPGAPEGQGN
jgi:hypothetical protein